MGKETEDSSEMKNLPQKKSGGVFTRTLALRQTEGKRTYLRVGDRVVHKNYRSWGGGVVMETRTSDLPGGFCFARILFQDGRQRVFDNSYNSASCCYYTGITLLNRTEL
jgi:hypothetical protein